MPKKPTAPPKLTPELPPVPSSLDDVPTSPGVETDHEPPREDDDTEIIHRDDLKR